jgi:electron transfer flavoprotein alpha subunit
MTVKILIITEQREGKFNNVSLEAITAAQQMAGHNTGNAAAELIGVVIGKGVAELAANLAGYQLNEILSVEHDLLEKYTPDGFTHALRQVIAATAPDFVVMPHTYQVRDFAPKLAASMGKGMIGDCIGHRFEDGRHIFVRQMFQGKTAADVVFAGEAPWIATFQASAFRGDMAARREGEKASVKSFPVELRAEQIRLKPGELFREAKQAVDLAQTPILVSVGRGIKAPENIAMAEKLAKVLGGELCASRPICDEGWLPMDRQIGSSGQTVAPKLYLALGISGAIQHVVGMKGSRTIVAVNKDKNAPIFEIADYGVVGDIFEIIPALTEELEKTA